MKENILIEKSIDFGARIVKLHRYLIKEKRESVIAKQILRSGTSIGANISEAQYGQSRADFYFKASDRLKGNGGNGVLASYPSKIGLP